MKQGGTTESQVKGEIHEGMTNNEKCRSPEFPEIGNVGVPEFSRNGKHRKFRSFRKSNNEWINIPRKLTGVPGCVRTMWTDSKRRIVPSLNYLLYQILPTTPIHGIWNSLTRRCTADTIRSPPWRADPKSCEKDREGTYMTTPHYWTKMSRLSSGCLDPTCAYNPAKRST